MSTLRSDLIRLAHASATQGLREAVLPVLAKTAAKTVAVWTVMYDGKGPGATGDGTHIYRTRSEHDAKAFAKKNTAYGKPAEATLEQVPANIAARWGV